MKDAVCGEGNSSACGQSILIKDYFGGNPVTVVTVTASHPLKTFWQPNFVSYGVGQFGVGIDPSNNGANLYNESALFHEALHGFTGLYDADLATSYRLNIPGVLGGPSEPISVYILNNVLSQPACTF